MANQVPRRTQKPATNHTRQERKTTAQRGYGARWQATAKGWLARHPLCAVCAKHGIVKDAACVDHIIPHRGDMAVFWDNENWQSLCKRCHDQKTASGE
jgi:5-methylcytosine-specific restriction protein A